MGGIQMHISVLVLAGIKKAGGFEEGYLCGESSGISDRQLHVVV